LLLQEGVKGIEECAIAVVEEVRTDVVPEPALVVSISAQNGIDI